MGELEQPVKKVARIFVDKVLGRAFALEAHAEHLFLRACAGKGAQPERLSVYPLNRKPTEAVLQLSTRRAALRRSCVDPLERGKM